MSRLALLCVAALAVASATTVCAQTEPASRPATSPPPQPGTIVVTFDGGEIGADMAAVAAAVHAAGALPVKTHILQKKENPCRVIIALGFTPACTAWAPLLSKLNAGYNSDRLPIGYRLTVPDLPVYPIRTVRTFSNADLTERKAAQSLVQNWGQSKNAKLSLAARPSATAPAGRALDRVVYDAYRIVIPAADDAIARTIVEKLQASGYPTQNVDYLVNWVQPQEARAFSAWTLSDVTKECVTDGGLTRRRYLDLSSVEPGLVGKLTSAVATPTVWIVDEPFVPSPNLVSALAAGAGDAAADDGQLPKCTSGVFDRNKHHATHMGGIIAGDGKGFEGLEPRAKLKAVPWFAASPAPGGEPQLLGNAAGLLRDVLEANEIAAVAPRNIYLIASSFPKTTLALTQNGQLGDPGKRNTEPPAKSIGKLRPIIIAAAGQEMTGKPAERLSPYYPAGPQNLGDWPTVIVVTACLQCSRNDAQLMKKASFSPTAVHVAAPGGSPVAGWIGPAEVGAAAGTSQAAAYAAGVAAAMIARFPADYAQAENLKAWMQITAWPIVEGIDANDGDAARLATGVIDPLRAQLDPRQSWMLKGDVWTSVRLGNFPVAPLVNSDGQTPQIISAAVRRLVRLAPRDTAPPYALISLGDTISEVVRTGPLTLGDGTIAVCEVGAAGSVGPRKIIELSEIQDLIIALQGVKANDCTA